MTARSPEPDMGCSTRRDAERPVHDARDLVGGDGTADIMLDDQTYRLRITRTGKLILTK